MILESSNRPQYSSIYNFVKLSFREGYSTNFIGNLNECLQRRVWEQLSAIQTPSVASNPSLPQIKLRTGIVGIERSLQEKQKATDESISIAFQDLDKLMTMAKDMVRISRNISAKIKVYPFTYFI